MSYFRLSHAQARQRAVEAVKQAPEGYEVRIKEPTRSTSQNAKLHAMLHDLSSQWMLHGRKWDAECMKRLCMDQFRRDTINDPEFAPDWKELAALEMAPSIDGAGVVLLGVQTRRLTKKLASAFVEWLYALGAEVGVEWSEREMEAA